MPQAASPRPCAELDQTRAPAARPGRPSKLRREAARLAEQAGAFGLFGLRLEPLSAPAPPQAGPPAAANDAAAPVRAFPPLAERGLYLPRSAPGWMLQALDWIVVIAAAEFAAWWGTQTSLAALTMGQAAAFLAPALALKLGLWLTGAYRIAPARIRPDHATGALALGAILGLIAASLLAPDARSAGALAATLPGAALVLAGLHAAFALWIAAAHRAGVFAEKIVLIGATEAARRLALRLQKSGEACVIAVADDRRARAPADIAGAPVGGDIDALLAWRGLAHVDRLVLAVPPQADARVGALLKRLSMLPHRIDLLLDQDVQSVRGPSVDRFAGKAAACLSGRPHCPRVAFAKRTQDLVLGALLAALFALPMLAIACAIRLESKGPILFRQQRLGFNNRVFTLVKFRTLRANGAPTRIGGVLRRTGLDELPQLYHVLKGEMSLVGPRPHAVDMRVDEWDLDEIVAEYAHRHRVKPGITGWAQVQGARGAVESPAALRRRLKLDLDYVARASLWLDVAILARAAVIAVRAGLTRP